MRDFKKEMKELSERVRKIMAELDEELDKYPGQSIIDLHKIDSIEDYFSICLASNRNVLNVQLKDFYVLRYKW